MQRSMARAAALLAARFERPLISHRGESGRRREDEVRAILADFLPKRYAVSTGEAVSVRGEVSPQLDIIVYDALETPVFDRGPNAVVIPIEGVLAVIEVASRLDSRKLVEDAKKIAAVKEMTRTAWHGGDAPSFPLFGRKLDAFPILGWIFAYEGMAAPGLARELAELDANTPIEHRVDGVYLLDQETIIGNFNTDMGRIAAVPNLGTQRHGWFDTDEQSGRSLMLFMTLLGGLLTNARANRPIAYGLYMGDADAMAPGD